MSVHVERLQSRTTLKAFQPILSVNFRVDIFEDSINRFFVFSSGISVKSSVTATVHKEATVM